MTPEQLLAYDEIPYPEREELNFIDELRHFPEILQAGPRLTVSDLSLFPETALASLKRHFPVGPGGIPLGFRFVPEFADEEFELDLQPGSIRISAAGQNGARYAVFELEERLAAKRYGRVRQKPYILRRITRSCFSPNSRPPLRLDELEDDVDYYPEAYLDRLAHERMNGVWITVYLSDMPNSFFPDRGMGAPRKLEKLSKVVERCARYGIKVYLFMAEPRAFSSHWKNYSPDDLRRHPELGGHRDPETVSFCTSSQEGRACLEEGIEYIFSHVGGLGGIINIMCQESSRPCALWKLYPHSRTCNCPRCSKREAPELFSEIAETMSRTMKKYQPDAEFLGWFYAAFHMPGEPENDILLKIAQKWPADATLLFNCETGGENRQLGKKHIVQDYSLSWPGPSSYWLKLASAVPKIGAKMQTGCSHEDATVPYLPVPDILYDRYDKLRKTQCASVMQCWYFGAFPGLMNRAAGRLSFTPFTESKNTFLEELARPIWGEFASRVAAGYLLFGKAYRNFPETLNFKWLGPLHHEVVFPWHLFPVDLPLAPSYTLAFPKNSGDRIGECFGYDFTPDEIRELLSRMDLLWQQGLAVFPSRTDSPEQIRERELAEAIGIQISGTRRWFEFYRLREEMIFLSKDHKAEIGALLDAEIAATIRMTELCLHDPRLGYHAEAESKLFFPAKLRARVELLRSVRNDDLARFDWTLPEIRHYTGKDTEGIAVPPKARAKWQKLGTCEYRIYHTRKFLIFAFRNLTDKIRLDFEPGRLNKIVTVYLTPESWNHECDFLRGLSRRGHGNKAELLFDLDFFRSFRISDEVPYRFNLSVDGAALHELHSLPGRLGCGDANPSDLIFLKLLQFRK